MRLLTLSLTLLLFYGCSTKRPDNAWQYDAAASAKYAETYFLEGKYLLSRGEFRRAEKSAKQSGDMVPLARLYLGQCALNRAVLLDDECTEYAAVAPLADDRELKSYHALLEGTLERSGINDLPKQYRAFAQARLKGDRDEISGAIGAITPLTSKMVAASLSREYLDEPLVEAIIDEASHLGYRRAVLSWMRHLANFTADARKRSTLEQKIRLLSAP